MLIVLEGLDGVGKSLQTNLLKERLSETRCISYHFPRHGEPPFGDLVSLFLEGKLGNIQNINPYLIALLFACDQFSLASQIKKNQNKTVVLDRYYYSNIAYQAAKFHNLAERKEFYLWLDKVIECFDLPEPDIVFYLEASEHLLLSNFAKQRTDKYENDRIFQQKVKEEYKIMIQKYKNFVSIHCSNDHGQWRNPEEIHAEIISHIEARLVDK